MFFNTVEKIQYEGPGSQNPLAYCYYQADQKVLGKTMKDHLRLAICYWHSFCWHGNDNFGAETFSRAWLKADSPLQRAEMRAQAAFEFFDKMNVPFYTFHDRDVSPEGRNFKETRNNLLHMADKLESHMQETGVSLLWGTANLFSHPRFAAGAATNPDPEVFAYAAALVKDALDMTQRLGGENYVLWGGREGYDTLLNTDMTKELDQFAKFLSMVVEYKHKIGFKGLLLIEPKPCEPTKHQYDFDTATVFAFLQKYGLEKEFRVNIEGNHATLAGHSFEHEVAYAYANDMFGSIDANQGDAQLGWDTDQFSVDHSANVAVLYEMLKQGGFTSGGFNFDTKLRRQSVDLEDLFCGHICGIDALAKALLRAADIMESGKIENFKQQRYESWQSKLGEEVLAGKMSLDKLHAYVEKESLSPNVVSGKQEMLERIFYVD
jgi:xylose isomerase